MFDLKLNFEFLNYWTKIMKLDEMEWEDGNWVSQRPFVSSAFLRCLPIWSTHEHVLLYICFVLIFVGLQIIVGDKCSCEFCLEDQIPTGVSASWDPSLRFFGARFPCKMTGCLICTFLPLFHKVVFDLLCVSGGNNTEAGRSKCLYLQITAS